MIMWILKDLIHFHDFVLCCQINLLLLTIVFYTNQNSTDMSLENEHFNSYKSDKINIPIVSLIKI